MPPVDTQRIYHTLANGPYDLGVDIGRLRPQFHLHWFETLSSTNTQLWQMAAAGATSGTVVIAQTQSTGKGQWGRCWQSKAGGLYLSLLLEPDWPVQSASQLTLCSAWGIAIAFNALDIPVKIKWPNDLVVQGQKLGGILTETKIDADKVTQAVIGIGINWQNPVPTTGITLNQILEKSPNKAITCLEDLTAIVLKGLWQGICHRQQVGAAAFMKNYQTLLMHLGQFVSLEGHTGNVVGVSASGQLQVQLHSDHTSEVAQLISLQPGEISLGYNSLELDSSV
ncbi:MAG: biotin--[acetyl-CoA-carboxylase] ligase [Cyanobacteria bacterium J06635_1]